ncbi:MAG TPA: hypothetical protein ENI65_09125 [Gammaproteobacteria bacterium]|nr:hypothetical protein [Gammaproteobacteria bacterium]
MMEYLDESIIIGKDEGDDNDIATAGIESQLIALEDRYKELKDDASPVDKAFIELQMARLMTGLDRSEASWGIARRVFDVFLQFCEWEKAVDACDVMFLSEQDSSLSALGQGIWLAVTYPIDPELTVAMLQHIIEETPDDADGAAVAAATAAYIADLRADEDNKDNLMFFTNQMLGQVSRRHSDVDTQKQFDSWIEKLELNDPSKFLVRLRNVVDVLVQDDWWFDREELQQVLPVN